MKRNVVSALAVLSLVAAFAAPAMADLNAFTVAGPNAVPWAHQAGRSHDLPMRFGIVNAAGTDLLPTSVDIVADSSSNISVTFGVKWVYDQPLVYNSYNYGDWAVAGVRFNVFWDAGEVSPTAVPLTLFPGGGPAGLTMLPFNYATSTIGAVLQSADAGAAGAITGFGLLANRGPGTTAGNTGMTTGGGTSGGFEMSEVAHNQLIKVGRATFHVDPGVHPDDGLDLFFTGGVSGRFFVDGPETDTIGVRVWSTLIGPSSVFVVFVGPGGYDVVVPEPASAGLFGIGLLAVSGGAWRRRRRLT